AVGDEQVHVVQVAEAGEVFLAVLGGVGEEHDPAGGGHRRAFHRGLGEVRRGEPVLGGEAVGRHEQHVGADLAVRAQRPGVDGGACAVPYASADEVQLEAGVVGEAGRDGEAVRDDGEGELHRQRAGEPGGRGAGVPDDRAVDGHLGQGRLGDAVLLVGGGRLAFGEVRLEVEAADRNG